METINKYYSNRANEYEAIYNRDDPIRQAEQTNIHNELESVFKARSVLEIACGTGYWTKTISKAAYKVLAIDYSPEVIEVAKSKNINAEFIVDDAFSLSKVEGIFDGGCANFWFSHIPKNKIKIFLETFHSKLEKGSPVFMADNIFIDGIGGELIHKSGDENTYKLRTLENGSRYEIIKNYYTKKELRDYLNNFCTDLEIVFGNCFWRIKYKTR